MRPPRAGDLTVRGTLQRPASTPTRNASGEVLLSWSNVATVWGCLKPLQGREAWEARQVVPDVTHRFWVRYSTDTDDLTTACRFVTTTGRVVEFHSAVRADEGRVAWWMIEGRERGDDPPAILTPQGDVILTPQGEPILVPS